MGFYVATSNEDETSWVVQASSEKQATKRLHDTGVAPDTFSLEELTLVGHVAELPSFQGNPR